MLNLQKIQSKNQILDFNLKKYSHACTQNTYA